MSNAAAPQNPGANFTFVQALRGIAAMWVVLFHASEGHHIDALKAVLPRPVNVVVFDSGHYGVAIFFALSGFVIAHSLRGVALTPGFLARFAARRSIRLDLPYWASIVFVLLVGAVSAQVQGQLLALPSVEAVAAHFVYLQLLLGYPPINTVYWTLTYEIQFYLFFAAMLVIAGQVAARLRLTWAMPVAWGAMALLGLISAVGLTRWAPTGLFVDLWAAFFVGVLAYHAAGNRHALGSLLILAAVMAWSPAHHDPVFSRISAATALVLAAAVSTGFIERGFNWAWLQFLGTISYSLYLLHNPISGAVGFLVRKGVGDDLFASVIALSAIVAASVAGAIVFWSIVERPAHRLSRRIKMRPAAASSRS